MRALFCIVGESGHFHPLVPIARTLVERGHTVAFATSPAFCRVIEHVGFEALPLKAQERDPASLAEAKVRMASLEGSDRIKFTLGMFLDIAVAGTPELVDHSRNWNADILFRETTAWSAWLAGELLEVPVALFDFAPPPPGLFAAVAGEQFAAARAAVGLAPDPELATLERWVNIVGGPPGWFPAGTLRPNTHLFQPPDFDASGEEGLPGWIDGLPDRPTVYATLGTTFNREAGVFEMIFDALGGEDLNVVATVGRTVEADSYGAFPENIRIEQYIPQSLVLPHCDAIVSHGGYSSLMGALRHGLPAVVLPLGAADNTMNAARVASLDAGIPISANQRSSDAIRSAVRRILDEPSYRHAARGVAQSIASLPPIAEAAVLVERLALERRPILASRE